MQTTTNPNPRTPKEKTWRSACHSALFTPLHLLPGGWRWKVLQEVLKWHCFDIAFFQVTSPPNPGGERFMPAVTVERTATASAVLFYDSETLNIPIPLSVQYVTPRWQHLHSSESHRAHCHSRRPGRCGVHGCISASLHDEDAQPLKSIHVKQTKEQSESKITMKSCDILFFVSLYMQIYFSSLGSILSLQTSGRWIVPSAARRSEFHFANLATLSFSHAKQHKFLSPPRSVNCQSELSPSLSHAARRSLQKKNIQKKKEKNSEMINLWGIAADSADMSEQEWRSLKLSRHPSVARWHPRSPAPLDVFFPAADERRWQEAWNALDLFIARRTAICLGTDAPLNSEMVG